MRKVWERHQIKPNSFDEYYTTYIECEQIFRPIINKLMDKRIHCPADDENSNIVKWLKDNTNSVITYSCLPIDMNSEEAHKLMLEANMVITNPPYSMRHWRPLFIWLNDVYVDEYHKDYFIWGPMPIAWVGELFQRIKYSYVLLKGGKSVGTYIRPDGSMKAANSYYYCSFKTPRPKLKYKEPKTQIKYHNGVPVFDRCENVPPTYGGWMYVPCSYINFINLNDYELDCTEHWQIPGKFVRWKIRRKRKSHDK